MRPRINPLRREKSRTSNDGDIDSTYVSCDSLDEAVMHEESSSSSRGVKQGFDQSVILKIRESYRIFGITLFCSIFSFAIVSASGAFIDVGLPSRLKSLTSFTEFYPFYLCQHLNYTCKLLHFIGTSIIIMMMIKSFDICLSFVPALFVGLSLRMLTVSLDTGLIEGIQEMSYLSILALANLSLIGIAMILVFLYTNKVLSGSSFKGTLVLLVGYGFAWVGHFFYELNQPATFIYPIYSLLGDFRMWYELATSQRQFTGDSVNSCLA